MRLFYATFLTEEPLATGIDALRLLVDPNERLRTHITLRGPYNRKPKPFKRVNSLLKSSDVTICDVGCFWEKFQNTVFLSVHSETLQAVVYKPDYPRSHSHLTIYDGRDRLQAEVIYKRLKERDICFQFRPSSLMPIISTPLQIDVDIWTHLDKEYLERGLKIQFNRTAIMSMSFDDRIAVFDQLLTLLQRDGIVRSRTSLSECDNAGHGNILKFEESKWKAVSD